MGGGCAPSNTECGNLKYNYRFPLQLVLSLCYCVVFHRGKRFSHDVDLLLSHADQKVTDILLDTLVDHLKREVS